MRKLGQFRRSVYIAMFFVLVTGAAHAEQDFYGIQMKNEEWARALVLKRGNPDTADLLQGPILNHAIRAEASLKEVAERHIDFRVTVFNNTESPMAVDYNFRDFLVYTRDGKKYSLVDTEENIPSFIEPRSKVSFAPSFGNLALGNGDVEMLVCSFDLGATKIILFPWSKKETVSKLVSPPPPPAPVKQVNVKIEKKVEKKKPAKKEKPPAPALVPSPPAPEQGPRKKTPKRNFWDWLALDNGKRKTPEDLKRAPVMPTAVERSAPTVPIDSKLDGAIKNFVYTPAEGVPATSPRSEARVIDFNRSYNFVTLNLGEQDGLKNGATLSIVRSGKLIAKAQVKQVRAAVSAATLLPGTVRSEVRAGDAVVFV